MIDRALSFLSWNLALLERSVSAPPYWDESATEAVVRDTVLDMAPDVVLYQELPGLVPFVETHSMMPANPRSHSGNLATLLTNELALTNPTVTTVDRCAVLTTIPEWDLTIANVHLAAGKGAAPDRLAQLTSVIEASPTLALLIVGDTNMRLVEAEPLIELGFTGNKPPHVTWDSRQPVSIRHARVQRVLHPLVRQPRSARVAGAGAPRTRRPRRLFIFHL